MASTALGSVTVALSLLRCWLTSGSGSIFASMFFLFLLNPISTSIVLSSPSQGMWHLQSLFKDVLGLFKVNWCFRSLVVRWKMETVWSEKALTSVLFRLVALFIFWLVIETRRFNRWCCRYWRLQFLMSSTARWFGWALVPVGSMWVSRLRSLPEMSLSFKYGGGSHGWRVSLYFKRNAWFWVNPSSLDSFRFYVRWAFVGLRLWTVFNLCVLSILLGFGLFL